MRIASPRAAWCRSGQPTGVEWAHRKRRWCNYSAAANGSDPRWVEQRRRTLRDNALTATLMPSVPGAADDPWARTHAADRPRRRVITD